MPERLLSALCLTVLLAAQCTLTGQAQPPIPQTRSTLEEWVLAERTLSAETEDWAAERATIEDIIRLLQDEKSRLQESLDEVQSRLTEADQHRSQLLDERKQLQAASSVLTPEIARYEARLRALAPTLPAPLQERIQPLLRRLPQQAAETRLSPAQRMQNVIGILGELDKFNREVTLDTRVQSLPDGRAAEVQAIYLGLSTAYFVDASGTYAGILVPGPEGWTAEAHPELAPRISRAIAQYQRQEPSTFINLPVSLP